MKALWVMTSTAGWYPGRPILIDRDSPYHPLWMLLEPTVRCKFRAHSSALCVPTFETKKKLDG